MVKIKLSQLKPIIESLNKLSEKEISITLSWKISELFDDLIKRNDKYSKELSKLFNEYAERDKQGKIIQEDNGFKLQADKVEKFTDKMNELNNIEIEVDKSSISLADLLVEDIKISPLDLYNLKGFIEK